MQYLPLRLALSQVVTSDADEVAAASDWMRFLELRAADPLFVRQLEETLARLDPGSSTRVVDLGCGTGVVARALARREPAPAAILGVDRDSVLIERAGELAAAEGLGGRVHFVVGDVERLDLPSASFDAATAHTVLTHVENPGRMLSEAARVLRPGGLLALFDSDYASWTFDCSDQSLAVEVEAALHRYFSADPWLLRRLPAMAVRSGFEAVDVLPFVRVEAGRGDYWLQAARKYAPRLVAASRLSAERSEAWLVAMEDASAGGTFFASLTSYAFILRRTPS